MKTEDGSSGLLLVAIALGMFLDGLDGTIVNVALPKMAESFSMGTGGISWVVTVYFLVMAGLILIMGRICDGGAVKKVMVWGFLIFSAGSLACGFSSGFSVLIAFRVVQGVGAAMLASSSVMVTVKYLPANRLAFGIAVGLLGSSVGAALGPALGGIISEFSSWHWIFLINVPMGTIGATIALKAVPEDIGFSSEGFDMKGSILLFLSLVCGLYCVESIPAHGIDTVSVIMLVGFLVLFPAFILVERRTSKPVIELSLFRIRRLDAVIVTFILINVCYMGALYLLPFFLRVEMGLGSFDSSLFLLIPAVATLVLCMKTGKMADERGNRPFVIMGCFVLLAFMICATMMSSSSATWFIVLAMALLGLTWGVMGGPVGSRLIENVPDDKRGDGSALLSFFIYFGCALGTAVFASLFGVGSGSSGTSIDLLPSAVFLDGFRFAMIIGAFLAVVSLILSWAINERKADE